MTPDEQKTANLTIKFCTILAITAVTALIFVL